VLNAFTALIVKINMGKRITIERFIEKAIEIHGDRYDYSLTEYKRWDVKVKIICKEHGVFEQTPNGHHSGRGCKVCGGVQQGSKKKINHETFIKKAILIHGDKYDYSKVKFRDKTEDVVIICKVHGNISVAPEVHLRACGCPKCGEDTRRRNIKKDPLNQLQKFKEIYGDKYDFNKTEYINSTTKITATCKTHGDFNKNVSDFLNGSGCPKCGNSIKSQHRVLTKEQFIEKSINKHGDKYDYSKTVYIKSNVELEIECKVKNHGIFKQKANDHLSGRGCQKCAELGVLENHNGWGYQDWIKCAEKSKNFESFKVYLIKCFNENEQFYKVGKTFTSIENRFKGKKEMPYSYEVIKYFIFTNGEEASKKEEELKKYNKKHQYLPKLKFSGRRECFNLKLLINEIIKL
jgi:predicted RNA-binding Zn-ribbon protein involved in translation (DUF1610 family)